jgi:hypothetical protein
LYILTSKCARHLNFQSALNMVCFVHFDFDMCFAPAGAVGVAGDVGEGGAAVEVGEAGDVGESGVNGTAGECLSR